MNQSYPPKHDVGESGDRERKSIRALRLTPLRDVEKVHPRNMPHPTQPPLSLRDPAGDRPLHIERPKRSWTWIHTAFLGGITVLLGILMYPVLFPYATVTVVPKTATLAFEKDHMFTASKDGFSGVRYSLIPIVLSESLSVPATQKKQVSEKARGMITIENRAQKTSQRLIKNTRFESASGKIYRIRESVIVPGYTETSGKITPGSLDVEVFADDVGAAYNLAQGTFTIPGLKDKEELFTGITARTKTALVGGSTGVRFVIPDSERVTAQQTLDARLRDRALAAAVQQVTPNTVLIPGAEVITFSDQPDGEEGTHVILNREITYTVMVFDRAELAAYFIEVSGKELPDTPASVRNIAELSVSLARSREDERSSTSPLAHGEVSFSLSRSPFVVWDVDREALARSLADVSRTDIESVLKKNPTVDVEKTSFSLTPFWNSALPSEDRITIVVSNPQ